MIGKESGLVESES